MHTLDLHVPYVQCDNAVTSGPCNGMWKAVPCTPPALLDLQQCCKHWQRQMKAPTALQIDRN